MRYVNYSRFSGDGINHLKLKSSAEQTIACYLLEGLMRIYQYELQYGMADRYEISENQKVIRFICGMMPVTVTVCLSRQAIFFGLFKG